MKKLFLFLPFFLLLSCSVQKRKYQNGFYVDWHAKNSKKETYASRTYKKAPVTAAETQEKQEIAHENLPALNRNDLTFQKSIKANTPPEDTCDVLVFKDGSEIKGKVKEIGSSEIKYKRCDIPDGPTYVSKTSEIFMIKYSNGTREVIKSEPAPRVQSPEPVRSRPNSNQTTDYRKSKYARQVHPAAIASLVFSSLALFILYLGALGAIAVSAIYLLPFLFALIAIITGIVALRKINQQPELYKGKGLAMPGMIIGMVIASIYLLVLLILLLVVI
ncbi:hypothetical protein CNR22_20550 [Sphingobacteriaceae bacterium]|nr:hypothetical protein CNR22_20550 [Sphingobacteriaceae bacterium]